MQKKYIKLIVVLAVIAIASLNSYLFYQGQEKEKMLEEQSERQGLSLQEAISLNNLDAVKFMLKNGADLEYRDIAKAQNLNIKTAQNSEGFTALGWALFTNRPEIAAYLIAEGADVKAELPMENMLFWAIAYEMNDVALILIDKGADISQKDSYNPAQHADIVGLQQVVEKLKEKGITLISPGAEELD